MTSCQDCNAACEASGGAWSKHGVAREHRVVRMARAPGLSAQWCGACAACSSAAASGPWSAWGGEGGACGVGARKPAAPPRRQGPAERGVVSADAGEIEARADGEGDEAKYARRPRSMRRSLQRAFPALFPASLPLTARRAPARGARGPARSGRCLRTAGAAARLRVAAPGMRAPQRWPGVRACTWASAQPPAATCLTQAWLQADPGPGGLRWVRIARCPISPGAPRLHGSLRSDARQSP